MSESAMRQNLVKMMKSLDAVPIENPIRAGTPDINYIGGWIECKRLKVWPVSADTRPVRFAHPLTKEQGLWLARRWMKGGTTLVCAQVEREWFFFSGETAKDKFGNMTRLEMREEALLYFPSGLEKERLIKWLLSISRG
jgi:hypothetical protein